MTEPRVLIGLDIGGTQTRAAAASEDGRLLGRAVGGPGNPVRVGPRTALRSIHGTLAEVLGPLGGIPVAACAVGMSGRSHPAAAGILRAAFQGRALPDRRVLRDDVSAAFEAAFPSGADGVLALAGTGSGAVARAGGTLRRVGGFGPALGDDGSAHAIVIAAARAVLAAAQGFGEPTGLAARFEEQLGAIDAATLGAAVGDSGTLATLFTIVAEQARSRDPGALGAIRGQAALLADLAVAAGRLVGDGPFPVALAGGAFALSETLRDAFTTSLRERVAIVGDPVVLDDALPGALAWARRALEEPSPNEF